MAIKNSNAASKPLVSHNLREHFKTVTELADVTATRTLREITGRVTLRDNNDNKVYLPSWITKRNAYQQNCHELGYEAKVTNTGNIEVIWVGDPEKELLKKNLIASWRAYVKY